VSVPRVGGRKLGEVGDNMRKLKLMKRKKEEEEA